MLDIKIIREDSNKVKSAIKSRNINADKIIDEILLIDVKRRELSTVADQMKNNQNIQSKQIPEFKKDGKDISDLMNSMKILSEEIKEKEKEITALELSQKELLLSIHNIPSETTPIGKSEDDNIEIRKELEPRKFEFEPLSHWDIGERLDILDPATAAKVTGARFHFYKGLGARLERAVINFYLDTHTNNGYTEIFPPFMVNRASMIGTGQLPKFEEDAFKLEGMDYFLIPTAEVPVTNMYRDEILMSENLPIKYCAYSACFRAEAGSAGRDQRGLIRQHQFNKVELVKFTKPEDSYNELEKLTLDAENLLKELKLPYRVVSLCSGDIGFASAKTYDIEVYMPSYSGYKEISSCSNFEDFQARRANIRYKDNIKDKAKFIHTLNGSGLAVGRTVAAILENYQNHDGSVTVPDILVKYMGCNTIEKYNK